jgi:hypothetical protein
LLFEDQRANEAKACGGARGRSALANHISGLLWSWQNWGVLIIAKNVVSGITESSDAQHRLMTTTNIIRSSNNENNSKSLRILPFLEILHSILCHHIL